MDALLSLRLSSLVFLFPRDWGNFPRWGCFWLNLCEGTTPTIHKATRSETWWTATSCVLQACCVLQTCALCHRAECPMSWTVWLASDSQACKERFWLLDVLTDGLLSEVLLQYANEFRRDASGTIHWSSCHECVRQVVMTTWWKTEDIEVSTGSGRCCRSRGSWSRFPQEPRGRPQGRERRGWTDPLGLFFPCASIPCASSTCASCGKAIQPVKVSCEQSVGRTRV